MGSGAILKQTSRILTRSKQVGLLYTKARCNASFQLQDRFAGHNPVSRCLSTVRILIYSNRIMDKQSLFGLLIGTTFLLLTLIYFNDERSRFLLNASQNFRASWSHRDTSLAADALQAIPDVKVTAVNCSKLAMGVQRAQKKALQYQSKVKHMSKRTMTTQELETRTKDCTVFLKDRPYIATPLSKEEEDFPVAFSILIYKDPGQAERLLRAIYQPQNFYCLHVDASSSKRILRALESLAACFPNVFMASKAIDVVWGDFSVLEPELVCMKDLFKRPNWKYFINLTGQEYPLQTNLELIRILKIFNGSNDVPGVDSSRAPVLKERTQFSYRQLKKIGRKEPFPVNLTLYKGAVHIAVTRGFVNFVLHQPLAIKFRKWSRDTGHPDEFFFNTLQHNPDLGVPGAYKAPEIDGGMSIARYKIWQSTKDSSLRCHGKFSRRICIPGVEDLPDIVQSKRLFLNKLHNNYQPLVQDCLEELHFRKIRDFGRNRWVDWVYYRKLPFIDSNNGY